MKKQELKAVLKPLIKECIKEVLLEEEGVLAHVIKESARATAPASSSSPIQQRAHEAQAASQRRQEALREARRQQEESRNKLREALSERLGGSDVFEGVNPIPSGGGGGLEHSPLRDRDPNDAGVDISAFQVKF